MRKLTRELLDLNRLRRSVDQDTFQLGKTMFEAGAVRVVEVSDYNALCHVAGTVNPADKRVHEVSVKVTDTFLYLKCDCRHAVRGLICEHDVAAWIGIEVHLQKLEPPPWRARIDSLVESAQSSASSRGAAQTTPAPYLLFFSLQSPFSTGESNWKIVPYTLSSTALPLEIRRTPAPMDEQAVRQLLESEPKLAMQVRAPHYAVDPSGCLNCSPESVRLANVMIERGRAFTFSSTFPIEDYLPLLASTHSPLYLGDVHEPLQRALAVLPEPGELHINLARDEMGLQVRARLVVGERSLVVGGDSFIIVKPSPLWVIAENCLFFVGNQAGDDLLGIFWDTPQITIPVQDEADFLERYLLEIARRVPVEGDAVTWELVESAPVPRLYLSDKNNDLQAVLRFGYGEIELPYGADLPKESVRRKPETSTLVKVMRQSEAEKEAHALLASASFGLKRAATPAQPGVFRLRARTHPVDFLLHNVPALARAGFEVFGEEQLKTARVNHNTPSISFHVSSAIDWFDVNGVVNFGELEISLKDIRRVMRKRERFIKLTDGTIGEIPEEWFDRYKHLFALAEDGEAGLRVSKNQLTLLDQALSVVDQAEVDEEYTHRQAILRALASKDFKGITTRELPAGFIGELRPYQKSGFDWLHFLHDYEFGGCLADDMGLGKTIQALAFLQSLYERPRTEDRGQNPSPVSRLPSPSPCPDHASLLVVPRSLLVNWQREASRFVPDLRIREYFEGARDKDLQSFDQYDLIITTYGVMLRDISLLHGYTFHYVILDESQTIKNPLSQTARAARLLQARHRLVLTGTPIENSTIELWSQFSFLNPGLLGNLEYFRTEFGNPIERKNDEEAAGLLRRTVFPFILRRTKDQVAPELPPRTERILYCDMDAPQRKLYNRMRDYFRGMLLGMMEKEGLNSSRMKILEGLLRLRQICNHPALVDAKYHGESGKFELLLETLETLRAENHKALIFSQFVQMLTLVRNALDAQHIPYTYLDGSTQDRQAQVDLFQSSPDIPFFLISLRAGGLGLNLTAADYVIHIDPWWNPAVEMQASDRTHRIGQDKPVFVFKLIARDSVEEKILLLQERKRNLVDQIITTESAFFKNLTEEDVKILFT